MKYLGRIVVYFTLFFLSFSVSYVLMLRLVPVTFTPLKIIRLFENVSDEGVRIDSRWRPLHRINMSMVKAVMASEDNNFLIHHGFDWEAIDKALEHNRRKDRKRKLGASTISQQTAKNVFCYPDRTWLRKGVEGWFTVLIELFWNKQRIVEVYLNVIETHPNVYGVEAAARRFFDKEAEHLNNYDAAMIATVLPNPRRMNLAAPSAYMVRRSAAIRSLMRKLPPVDFEHPVDPSAPKKRQKR